MQLSLMIATPFYNMAGLSPYISSLVSTIQGVHEHTPLLTWSYYPLSGDSYVDRARDTIAHMFLESSHTHLLFIDSDMAWDFPSFLRVLVAEGDMVGAAYPCKNSWNSFGVKIKTDSDGVPQPDPDGLLPAEYVPTGFCKISRTLLEAMAPQCQTYTASIPGIRKPAVIHAFFTRILQDGVSYGEDVSFCKRALELVPDARIRVEPRVSISHIGTKSHHINYHEWLQRQPRAGQPLSYRPVQIQAGSDLGDISRYIDNLINNPVDETLCQ